MSEKQVAASARVDEPPMVMAAVRLTRSPCPVHDDGVRRATNHDGSVNSFDSSCPACWAMPATPTMEDGLGRPVGDAAGVVAYAHPDPEMVPDGAGGWRRLASGEPRPRLGRIRRLLRGGGS